LQLGLVSLPQDQHQLAQYLTHKIMGEQRVENNDDHERVTTPQQLTATLSSDDGVAQNNPAAALDQASMERLPSRFSRRAESHWDACAERSWNRPQSIAHQAVLAFAGLILPTCTSKEKFYVSTD
jgi:hypothetical protein